MSDAPVEVIRVTARDEDSVENSRVAYQLRDIGNEVQGVFQMDGLSGRITALTALDREATPMYSLTIIATDSGKWLLGCLVRVASLHRGWSFLSTSLEAWVHVEGQNPELLKKRYAFRTAESGG